MMTAACWLKLSLSRRLSERAPQLTRTNGPLPRGDSSWIALAINSFPVPVSPTSNTEAFDTATRRVMAYTSCIAGAVPIRPLIGGAEGSSPGWPEGGGIDRRREGGADALGEEGQNGAGSLPRPCV